MRLIDAEELLKKTAHWKEICTSGILIRMIDAFEKGISEVQTIPAIPVVRCWDCINFAMYRFFCDDEERTACVGRNEDGVIDFATATDPDGYCYRGKKR